MVLNNIENLLEKYNNAETTLQEEAQLKAYFTSDAVAPHLEHYKALFGYFKTAQNEVSTKDIPSIPIAIGTRRKFKYQWISAAAVAILMFGIMIPQMLGPTEAEKQEALLAYNQTIEILNLVSIGMNQGKAQLNAISLVSDNMDKAANQVSLISEFNKATDKFLKTSNKK